MFVWTTPGRTVRCADPSVRGSAKSPDSPWRDGRDRTGADREGARAVFTPSAAGDHLDYTFHVERGGDLDVLLRYHRSADGGLVTVTIDGRKPHDATIDTTSEVADGYDILALGTVRLSAGRHTLRFTSAGAGRGGGQIISLDELSVVRAPAHADVNEDITIDNGALGFTVVSGTWASGTGVAGYYGGNYQSHAAGDGTSTVRWRPALPADAQYEVTASYTAASNRSRAATYTVHHAGGSTPVGIDQTAHGTPATDGSEWVSLGTFSFTAGLDGSVELSDAPDGCVIADAVRFIRRSRPQRATRL